MGTLGRLKHLPLARQILLFVVFSQLGDDLCGNGLEVVRCEGQDGGTSTRQTDAKKTFVSLWGHCFHDLSKAGNQSLSVGLVDLILHSKMDKVGVGR